MLAPIVEATPSSKEIWISKLAECESMGSTTIKVLDTNGYFSYGKYQWQMASWLNYRIQGATKENILDEKMQDKITRYALDQGKWEMWYNCGKIINKKLGKYGEDL